MIFARNKIALTNQYVTERTYKFAPHDPVWKLTVACDAAIRIQLSEDTEATFGPPTDEEIELDPGTHSLAFVKEKFAIRMKAAVTSANVSFRVEGPA